MTGKRNGLTYFFLSVIIMIMGLTSRRFSYLLPGWVHLYLGDVLWALMVFLVCGLLFRTRKTGWIAGAALLISFSVEISQLYQAHWINALRDTTIGALLLGRGFLWSDLVSYTLGIAVGVVLERYVLQCRRV